MFRYGRSAALIALSSFVAPAVAHAAPAEAKAVQRLTDEELAQHTGKFVLPNGVELALSISSDTIVDGQPILRTTLTIDRSIQLQVYGRTSGSPGTVYPEHSSASAAQAATGLLVEFDRKSGIQTLTPTFGLTSTANVTVEGTASDPAALGLSALPLSAGGPAVATADGVVSLDIARNGSQQVTLAGDRLGVVNLVGQSIATALVNSASDRTLDSVTNVAIDVRNLAPYQLGMAQMRVEALGIDATREMVR